MAEFLTMEDAENKFGTKGRTNAGLTLGIIGTALAALGNNGGGCGCGNNGGILGGLFGGNNGTAASNWNAVNTAINGACPSCQAQ